MQIVAVLHLGRCVTTPAASFGMNPYSSHALQKTSPIFGLTLLSIDASIALGRYGAKLSSNHKLTMTWILATFALQAYDRIGIQMRLVNVHSLLSLTIRMLEDTTTQLPSSTRTGGGSYAIWLSVHLRNICVCLDLKHQLCGVGLHQLFILCEGWVIQRRACWLGTQLVGCEFSS